jgi:hypothetical protein
MQALDFEITQVLLVEEVVRDGKAPSPASGATPEVLEVCHFILCILSYFAGIPVLETTARKGSRHSATGTTAMFLQASWVGGGRF